MKKPFIYLLFILSLAAISCHKETPSTPPQPLPYRYCPQELLDYCIFKPGSYWIYQDTNTKRTDSVYVTAVAHDTAIAVYSNGSTQKGDEYGMAFTDVYNGWSYQYSIPLGYNFLGPNDPTIWSVILTGSSSQGFSGTSYPVDYPIPFNLTGDATGDSIQFCNNYFRLNINSMAFDSVIYQKHSLLQTRACDFHYLGRKCKEYYTLHYGLVRYELPDSNQVWNLLRYHLMQ